MITTPHAHQKQAFEQFLALGHGAIFADMGTGKGLIALMLADAWAGNVLVLCPKSVLSVWEREPDKHYPGRWLVCVPRGPVPRRVEALRASLAAATAQHRPLLFAANYEALLSTSLLSALKATTWSTLVLDESHRIKAPAGRTSRLVSQLADRCAHRLLLTGTPMPHSPMDLYAQFRAMKKGVLPLSAAGFRSKYAVMGGYGGHEIIRWRNIDELADRINPWTFRAWKSDVLDLPPFTHTTLPVELPPAARRAYTSVADDLRAQVEAGTVTAANAIVRCLRLQQIAQGVTTTDEGQPIALHSEKRDALQDLLTDLPPKEPCVIFGLFHSDLDAIHHASREAGRASLEISGRTTKSHINLQTWQAGEAPDLAVQIQAGGVGIDLSRSAYAVFYASTWSLGDYEQALARIHRPGQERPVDYYHIVATNTIDRDINTALRSKADVASKVIAALRGSTPEGSTS